MLGMKESRGYVKDSKGYVGKVKWFNPEKGYGFIEEEESKKDIFVHWTQIIGDGYKSLEAGEAVEFGILKTEKGAQATCVLRLGGNANG